VADDFDGGADPTVMGVAVDIYPVAKDFGRKLKAQVDPQAAVAGRRIAEEVSKPIGRRISAEVVDGVRSAGRAARPQAARSGQNLGQDMSRTLRASLAAGLRNLPEVKIDGDSSKVDRMIAQLRAEMLALSDIDVDIDVNDEEVLVRVQAIRRQYSMLSQEIEKLRAQGRDVPVDVDALQGLAEMTKLKRELRDLRDEARRPVRVRVETDSDRDGGGIGAIDRSANRATRSVRGLILAAVGIAPVIVPVAAAAAGALFGIVTMAMAGVAALGVLALGFSGILGAVQSLGKAQGAQAEMAAAYAAKQKQVAAATEGVRQAREAYERALVSAAESQRAAAERVAAADERIADAQDRHRQAQEALTEAREDAARALEDLEAAQRGGELAERQAVLTLERARKARDEGLDQQKRTAEIAADLERQGATEALDQLRERAQAEAEHQEQLQLDFEQAEFRLEQQRLSNQRTAQEKADADRAGVEGSDQVRAALDRVAAAQRDERDAVEAAAEARRRQGLQAEESAYQIAQAERAIVQAQQALADTRAEAVQVPAAIKDMRDQMAGLTPEGRRFALFLHSLRDTMRGFRDAAQIGLLPGVQAGLQALLPYAPQLTAFIGALAATLGDLFEAGLKALTAPFWQEFFGWIGDTAAQNMTELAQTLGYLAQGFAGLLMAFSPFSRDMSAGLVDLTRRFAEWASTLDQNPAFQEFLAYVREYGPQVVSFLGELITLVVNLGVTLAPLGTVMMAAFTALFRLLNDLDPTVLAIVVASVAALVVTIGLLAGAPAAAIYGIIVGVIALVAALTSAYERVGWFRTAVDASLRAVADAATWLWQQVLVPFGQGVADVWQQVIWPAVSLVAGMLVDTWQNNLAPVLMWLWHQVFRPAGQGMADAVGLVGSVVSTVFGLMVAFFTGVVAPAWRFLYDNVVAPVLAGITTALQVAWAIWQVIFGLIEIGLKAGGAVWMWLYERAIRPSLDAAGVKLTFIWHNVIKPVLNAVAGFIRDHVAPAWQAGLDILSKKFETFRQIASAPIRFVIETVINKGLIGGFNWVAEKVGADPIPLVPVPKFAQGGVLPGYTPGRDVHRFFSPTGGMIDLSGGEAIMRPEFTAALGAAGVHSANAAARAGGVAGVRAWLAGLLNTLGGDPSTPAAGYIDGQGRIGRPARFATGGIYHGGFNTGGIFGALATAWNTITDPVGAFRKIVEPMLDQVPGAGAVRDIAVATGQTVLSEAAKWVTRAVKGVFGFDGQAPEGVSEVQQWIRAQAGKPYVWAAAGPHGYDCSGLVGAVYQLLRGGNPHQRVFSTHNMADFFDPGRGVYTVGWAHAGERGGGSVGHTAGNLAGLPFESRGSRGVLVGPQAADVGSFARVGHMGMRLGGVVPRLFDSGGYLPRGISVVDNRTSSPEPVLTDQQWQAVRQAAVGGDQPRGDQPLVSIGEFHAHGDDPHQVAAELDWLARGLG